MESKNIELKPVVSEKSYKLANSLNKYVFLVDGQANKIEIKKAVEKKYKVTVENVNTTVRPGKKYGNWKVGFFRQSDVKKAVVQLKKGNKIDEFLNI